VRVEFGRRGEREIRKKLERESSPKGVILKRRERTNNGVGRGRKPQLTCVRLQAHHVEEPGIEQEGEGRRKRKIKNFHGGGKDAHRALGNMFRNQEDLASITLGERIESFQTHDLGERKKGRPMSRGNAWTSSCLLHPATTIFKRREKSLERRKRTS